MENQIKVGDIALHKFSGLYYICENKKQEVWMNFGDYYSGVTPTTVLPESYFKKESR